MKTKVTLVFETTAEDKTVKVMLDQVSKNPMLLSLLAKVPFKINLVSSTIEPLGGPDGPSKAEALPKAA